MNTYLPKKLPVKLKVDLKNIQLENQALILLKKIQTLIKIDPHFDDFLPILMKEESFFSLKRPKKRLNKIKFFEKCSKFHQFKIDKDDPYLEVINYYKALRLAFKEKRVSKKLFFILHEEIKKGHFGHHQKPFEYRLHQNWIGKEGCKKEEAYFFPPSPAKVPLAMENLIRFLNQKDDHILQQIAIAFAQFLIIHPFMDGNGRVARAVIPFFLKQKKVIDLPILFLSEYFKKNKLSYFQKLYQITQDHDWNMWITFFLKGVIYSCKKLIKKIQQLSELKNQLVHLGIEESLIRVVFKEVIVDKKKLFSTSLSKKDYLKLKKEGLMIESRVSSLVSIHSLIPKMRLD